MKLGLGLGIAFVAANQHLTAGGGGQALYGLTDDGEGGWVWTDEPLYGLTDGEGDHHVWTTEYLYLFDGDGQPTTV